MPRAGSRPATPRRARRSCRTCAATSPCCATTSRRKTRCCSRWPTSCSLPRDRNASPPGRVHIAKEDEMLFPMADELFSPARQERVLEGFERVEREETGEGAHEKFHALAAKLEREARAISD